MHHGLSMTGDTNPLGMTGHPPSLQNKRQALAQESDVNADDGRPAKKVPKRSLAATIERMEKHKILERKRREKTKELVSELQGLIPSVEMVPEGLTMNTVLEEAIEHLKAQHAKPGDAEQPPPVKQQPADDSGDGRGGADDKGDQGGMGRLARAFGRSESDTQDVFDLMQNQIEEVGPAGGRGAVDGGGQSTMSLALEAGSERSTDQLQVRVLGVNHYGK